MDVDLERPSVFTPKEELETLSAESYKTDRLNVDLHRPSLNTVFTPRDVPPTSETTEANIFVTSGTPALNSVSTINIEPSQIHNCLVQMLNLFCISYATMRVCQNHR